MTFTAVLVVFLALLMLVLIFRCIGIFFQRRNAPKVEKPATQKAPAASSTGKPSAEALVAISLALQSATGKPDEVAAVIAMALRSELETQHDHESYVLTIRHRPTMWNAHVQQGRARRVFGLSRRAEDGLEPMPPSVLPQATARGLAGIVCERDS